MWVCLKTGHLQLRWLFQRSIIFPKAIDGISSIEKDTHVESWNTKNLSRNNTITYSDEPLKTWVFWELKSRGSTFKLPDPARSAAGNTGQVPVWADSHFILRHMNEPVALERTLGQKIGSVFSVSPKKIDKFQHTNPKIDLTCCASVGY